MKGVRFILVALFLLVFTTQLYIAFQTENFTYESYHYLRHIENIQNTGVPLYDDHLSYGGRKYYYPPLFHYLMAATALPIGLENAAKIIPPLIFSLLIFIVHGIAYRITKHEKYALLSAVFYSFSPITYLFPISNVSPLSLAIPLLFGIVYLMMGFQGEQQLPSLLILIVALVFTHPSAFILLTGLVFYLFLLKLEGMRVEKKNTEIVLFTMFMVFWALFIIYKNVFLTYGFKAVWQNVPRELLEATFPSLSFLNAVYLLGAIPMLLGIIGAYQATFNTPNKNILLLLGFSIAIFLALWLNFIRLEVALLFLSILLAILSAQGLKARVDYMNKTKLYKYKHVSMYLVLFFFLISSVFPLYVSAQHTSDNMPSDSDIKAMKWLRRNIDEQATILAPLKQGHALAYFANRKNVIDTKFIMMKDANERLRDVNRIYKIRLESEAIRLLTKYGADYVFFGDVAKTEFKTNELFYTKNRNCFTAPYSENTTIYRAHCTIG